MTSSGDFPEMTETEPTVARQLAAMRLLFDSDRRSHESDVLLASIFEILSDGTARTVDEIRRQVEADWKGWIVPRETVETALAVAHDRGFLDSTPQLLGTQKWTLSATANLRVDESKEWAQHVLDRFEAQVRERARDNGDDPRPEQVKTWVDLLLNAMQAAVSAAFVADPTDSHKVYGYVFPPFDQQTLEAAIASQCVDPDICRFLTSLAFAALDPASEFGSEVVHFLATGYALHALLLGQGLEVARQGAGSVAGQVFLLDTNVLLRLLDHRQRRHSLSDLLGRIARAAGAVIAVTPKTREELRAMLDTRDRQAESVEREISLGYGRDQFAITIPDEVLVTWLEDPTSPTWEVFKTQAMGVLDTLAALGAAIDYVPTNYVESAQRCAAFKDAVQTATRERSGSARAALSSVHDGSLLGVAEHLRSSEGGASDSLWPGAFIVTSDRSLDDAYRKVTGRTDAAPVAMPVTQLASLLSRFAQIEDVEAVAAAIASEQQWRRRIERSVAFSMDQAIEVARSLNARDLDGRLVEVAETQLAFQEIVTGTEAGDSITAIREAIARREADHARARRRHQEEQRTEVLRAQRREAEERGERRAIKQDREELERTLKEVMTERDREAAERKKTKTLGDRRVAAGIGYTAAAGALIALAVAGWISPWQLVIGLAAVWATFQWTSEWLTNPDVKTMTMLVKATAALAFGVVLAVGQPVVHDAFFGN